MTDGYPVPAGRFEARETVKHSLFIATAMRVRTPEEARAAVVGFREAHKEANHNCFAFVAGPPGEGVHTGMSDDGEPKGTAGAPMHRVLTHCGIGEILVVVTRYFGGVKLGTGGIVKAYSAATRSVLDGVETVIVRSMKTVNLRFGYDRMDGVERWVRREGGEMGDAVYAEDIRLSVTLPESGVEAALARLVDGTAGNVVIKGE